MSLWFRAGTLAALAFLAFTPLKAAEKPFQDAALDDAAIKLRATLKENAGAVEQPVIVLKKNADAALKEGDVEGAASLYAAIVTAAPGTVAPAPSTTMPETLKVDAAKS